MSYFELLLIIMNIMIQTEENDNKKITFFNSPGESFVFPDIGISCNTKGCVTTSF